MGRNLGWLLGFCSLAVLVGLAVADNKVLCDAWRINVELHNIPDLNYPSSCSSYIDDYMKNQFLQDYKEAIKQCSRHLEKIKINHGGNNPGNKEDAWVFDLDDILLSKLPYAKEVGKGSKIFDKKTLKEWVEITFDENSFKELVKLNEGGEALHKLTLELYNEVHKKGIKKIFFLSSRTKNLKNVDDTFKIMNLAGYELWLEPLLRGSEHGDNTVHQYKAAEVEKQREKYNVLGIVGSQWTRLLKDPTNISMCRLPNPLDYDI